jgi:hypothetical protein
MILLSNFETYLNNENETDPRELEKIGILKSEKFGRE